MSKELPRVSGLQQPLSILDVTKFWDAQSRHQGEPSPISPQIWSLSTDAIVALMVMLVELSEPVQDSSQPEQE